MDILKKIKDGHFSNKNIDKNIELRYLTNPYEIVQKDGKSCLLLSRTELTGESHCQKAHDTHCVVEEIEFDLLIKVYMTRAQGFIIQMSISRIKTSRRSSSMSDGQI